jgi:YegS/Rv2252/BmrU family lipid kinase
VILSGASRRKDFFRQRILPALSSQFAVQVEETRHRGHAAELACSAAEAEPYAILAAGGDGTLNEVLNGILASGSTSDPAPALGAIPLGTGNDFARLCGCDGSPESIRDCVCCKPRPTDVGRVVCRDEQGSPIERHFINHASVGMGPAVVQRLEQGGRSLGPSLTYLKAILQTFFTHRPEAISVRCDGALREERVRVFAVLNGRSFGSGIHVAPQGRPDDGAFSTFLAGEVPLPKFLLHLQTAKAGRMIRDPKVVYGGATRIEIASPLACRIELDGEHAGFLPATIEILPARIGFLRRAPA